MNSQEASSVNGAENGIPQSSSPLPGYHHSNVYGMNQMYQPGPQAGPPGFNWNAAIYQIPQNQQQYSQPAPSEPQWQQQPPMQRPMSQVHAGYPPQTYPPQQASPSPVSFDHRQMPQPTNFQYGYPVSQQLSYYANSPQPRPEFERTDSPHGQRAVANASPANGQSHFAILPSPMSATNSTNLDAFGFPPKYQGNPGVTPQFIQPQFLHTTQADMRNAAQQHQMHQPLQQQPPQLVVKQQEPVPSPQPIPPVRADNVQVVIPAPPTSTPTTTPPASTLAAKPKKVTKKKEKDPNAPKAPRGRPRKNPLPATKPATKEKKASASSSSDSESDSDSELEIEKPEPFPLPDPKPTEELAAAKYDTVKAVWYPRNRDPKAEDVRNAVSTFADLVRSVRDSYKSLGDSMKTAHVQNQDAIVSALSKGMEAQRAKMELVLNTVLEFGHPVLVERLGENPYALISFYSFLVDRFTAGDNDSSLTIAILKVMVKFTRMDTDMLEKTKNDKILSRLSKRGGATVRPLAIKILGNAATAKKNKAAQGAPSSKEGSPAPKSAPATTEQKPAQSAVKKLEPESVAGTKRPADGDTDGPAAKKSAAVAAKVTVPKATTTVKRADAKPTAVAASNASTEKKPAAVTPKPPTSFIASFMSASKRPGTSNAERAAAAAKATADKVAASAPPPPPKPAFSFSDTLASLGSAKEPEAPKQADEAPPETEEEMKKRLRKEERRKLRVTWRPDDQLCQIRLFTHAPEEDRGHDDSMMRDAGDVRSEGRMLKMHKDFDMEDADEEEYPTEIDFSPYKTLSEVDFDEIDPAERNKNYQKYGGPLIADSPEKIAQEKREATTLMVVHASPADIPDTPKEPPASEADEKPTEDLIWFGTPDDRVRSRAERYYAAMMPAAPAPQVSAPSANGAPDLASLLQMLKPQQPQPQPQQQPQFPVPQQQQTQPPMANLLSLLSGAQQPTTPAPAQVSTSVPDNLSQIVAMFAAGQKAQPQQAPQPPPQMPAVAPNLAQLLASMTGQAPQQLPVIQAQNPQNQQPPTTQSYNDERMSTHNHNNDNNYNNNNKRHYEDRKRPFSNYDGASGGLDYDDTEQPNPNVLAVNGHGYNGNENREWRPNKKSKMSKAEKKKNSHHKYQLLPCRYFAEGRCKKGDDCTYRHDV